MRERARARARAHPAGVGVGEEAGGQVVAVLGEEVKQGGPVLCRWEGEMGRAGNMSMYSPAPKGWSHCVASPNEAQGLL